jgi:hypothetical protein
VDFGFPFRTVPELPVYMLVGVGMAIVMGVVVVIVSRVSYGAERTRALMPLFGRVTLAWALLAVAAIYLVPFVLAFVIGAPFG